MPIIRRMSRLRRRRKTNRLMSTSFDSYSSQDIDHMTLEYKYTNIWQIMFQEYKRLGKEKLLVDDYNELVGCINNYFDDYLLSGKELYIPHFGVFVVYRRPNISTALVKKTISKFTDDTILLGSNLSQFLQVPFNRICYARPNKFFKRKLRNFIMQEDNHPLPFIKYELSSKKKIYDIFKLKQVEYEDSNLMSYSEELDRFVKNKSKVNENR